MRKVFRVLLLMAIVLSACESEQKRSNMATGMLALNLATSQDVIDATTTRAEAGDSGEENTEEDDLVPDVGDFTIALMDGNVVKTSWDKFSEFPKYAVVPVGTYTLKAYCGNSEKEGFESPYYEGTQEITVEDDETVEASITCYLTNVKLSVEYTDAFKKYFSDYSTVIQSDGGSSITFVKDEVRAAYVKPGVITIYADVVNQNGQTAKWEVGEIDEAKPREFYHIKLDVDAGSATLKISFDKTTVEKPVEIDVSDEALNIQPPFFTRSGYESGVVQDVKEGSTIFPLSTLVTARNGIKKCVLTTVSPSLLAQGWPTSVDLVNLAGETLEKLKSLGLSMRGLSTNVEKMATLDFAEVIPYLLSDDGEVSFSLVVTDKAGRVNAVDEVIKVNVQDNQFAVGTVDNVNVGLQAITIPVTLDGDISRVKFQYLKEEVLTDIDVSGVLTDGIQHQVTLALPFITSHNFLVYVTCGVRTLSVSVGVNPPVFGLEASEGDVWATKATIHVVGKDKEYMKTQPIVIEYIKSSEYETGTWVTPTQTKDGDVIEITGLPEDPLNTNKYTLRAVSGDVKAENELEITTEVAAQIPNSDFEDWTGKQVWYKTIVLSGGEKVWAFYPSATSWWSSRNDKTTQSYDGVASWFYASYPSTVPTSYDGWTAYNHLNKFGGQSLTIASHRGTSAMEISTVGHGANNWLSQESAQEDVDYRTAGSLFIGTYDRASQKETLGHTFNSRPSAVEFYYKYYSYNNESAKAYAVLYNAEKKEIARGELLISNPVDTYEKGTVSIAKTTEKAAYITVVFLSSSLDSPATLAIQGSKGAWRAGYGDSRHVGSVLTIDDVKLIY